MVAWYCALVALVGLERLLELRISKRNFAAAMAAGGHEAFPRHFIAMSVMHTLFLFSCAAEAFFRPFYTPLAIAAFVLVLLAQALRYWVIGTLGVRWNVRIVVFPNAPLVATGPYRFLRHPNYVAVAVEIIALPLIHSGWVTAVVFTLANAIIMAVRIPAEEAALGIRS
jgi:methyltransferase